MPVDDPQIRQPDITRAKQVLGLGARDPARGRFAQDARLPPRTSGCCVGRSSSLTATVVAAGFFAGHVSASGKLQLGLFDDPQVLGRPDQTFPLLTQLRVQVIRVTLHWGGAIGVARTKPTDATDPGDPAYDWFPYDRAVRDADAAGIKVMFSIVDTPRWANGSKLNRSRRR